MDKKNKLEDIDLEAESHREVLDHKAGVPIYADDEGAIPGASFEIGDSTYAKIQRFVGKFGVEQRGIERVPEDERTDTNQYKIGTVWLSTNLVVASFAIGVLARTVFRLGFVDAFLVILFINILGALPVSFFSIFGPRFGLRQVILSRFYFGYYGVKLIAFLNIVACVGWASVNVIVGAQLLNTVNSDVPGWAGIVIIAVCTLLLTCFGYKIVHAYDVYSWIPTFIICLFTLGAFAHTGDFVNVPMGVGQSEIGSVFSFAAAVFGFATGWTCYAADYAVYQPANTPSLRTFLWTFGGLIIPLWLMQMLGLAIATAYEHPPPDVDASTFLGNIYTQGYNTSGIGGLLGAVLIPAFGRFGSFCLVILALSTIAGNCPNIYSSSLSLQVLARQTQRVPRFIWTFFGTLIYCAIAIPGYIYFEQVLENFMLLIAYWLAIYEGVALTDHVVFKRGFSGYNIAFYDVPAELPPGFAAVGAFLFGVLGAVLGMSQTWFVGPLARHVGLPSFGGDIGFELAFGFTSLTYLGFRLLEKRHFGR